MTKDSHEPPTSVAHRESVDYRHGGNLLELGRLTKGTGKDLLDMSVNLRPEGLPAFISAALLRSFGTLTPYPSPHAEELIRHAADYYQIAPENLVFGNGATELIHALPRATFPIPLTRAVIPEPAFSEYQLASRRAGLPVLQLPGDQATDFIPDFRALDQILCKGDILFLANPSNPVGTLLPQAEILALAKRHPDVILAIDESFIDYAEPTASLLNEATTAPNLIVLHSLTKFYGMAGLRSGFAVASPPIIQALREALPTWNMNTPAIAATLAVFDAPATWSEEERVRNIRRRNTLAEKLSTLPGLHIHPSQANFLLLALDRPAPNLAYKLLTRHGIAIRDCSNYRGLEGGCHYRIGVRTEEENERVIAALQAELIPEAPAIIPARRTPALMLQGTSSDAGKSILTTAFCRLLFRDGFRPAPFKAQNMALNSGVTADGLEMGRAQIVQARACFLDPDVRMNPILLKPHSHTGSQVVVMGTPRGHMEAREYFAHKHTYLPEIHRAYDSLAAENDIMVIEGAGSPGEINLKAADVVNMNMARYAEAKVLLVGDIDRGGLYASFLGTWLTFEPWERNLLDGFIVNRFRGDESLLHPAHDYIYTHTGTPVLGTIPMLTGLNIPEEDRAACAFSTADKLPDSLDVAIIMLPHVANFTDFAPLAAECDIRMRQVRTPEDWGKPDLIIIPGSKNVAGDLGALHTSGLVPLIMDHARADKPVLGVCGGLQMLGTDIFDPLHIESAHDHTTGLGLLSLTTTFAAEKTLLRIEHASSDMPHPTGGYEIHHGISTPHGHRARPWTLRPDGTPCGYMAGNIRATYLHGFLDADGFRRDYINAVRIEAGLPPHPDIHSLYDIDASIDRLADALRDHTDIAAIYNLLHLG